LKIGITGTRSGCTEAQFNKLRDILYDYPGDVEFHHGDCVGVDAEAAIFAKELGMKIVCHPPEKDDLRAYVPYDECREKFSHFKRNRNIVDSVDLLIVVPWQSEWSSEGGTWYTHDYARKHLVKTLIRWPDGTYEWKEN
jgi:hypothetical protein